MIYIIDDDQYVRRGFGMLLKSAGHEYMAYTSAKEFLEQRVPTDSDLIILDYQLPEMDGCKLMEYFMNQKLFVPVIVVTAYDNQISRDCAKKYGVLAYFRKPVDGEALLDLIEFSFTHTSLKSL